MGALIVSNSSWIMANMPIHVQCNNCQRRFRAPDAGLGKTGRCPNCGNRITIQPVDEQLPAITVAPESANQALRKSSSSIALLVIVATVFVCGVAGVIGLLIYRPQPTDSVEVEAVEAVDAYHSGLGLTLEQFKREMPIGDSWSVMSEIIRDDGTVGLHLACTELSSVTVSVAGNPNDLCDVCIMFAITVDPANATDKSARYAAMGLLLSKYSNWEFMEIIDFVSIVLPSFVTSEDGSEYLAQKNGHELWMVPTRIKNEVFFLMGVRANTNSTAPTLKLWLESHPLPAAAGLPLAVGLNESTVKAGKVTNGRFSFKGFRHKGRGDFVGEMTNDTNQDIQAAFKLSVYDRDAALIDTAPIVIFNFGAGQTRSFEAYVEGAPKLFFYKIDLETAL